MTASEVKAKYESRGLCVVHVWEHKTVTSHGSAKIVMPPWVYEILMTYTGDKTGADRVFQTTTGEPVTHLSIELEKLGNIFGKKLTMSPTTNRKTVATTVGRTVSDAEERRVAAFMSHSLNTARSNYQHLNDSESAVEVYQTLQGVVGETVSESPVPEEPPAKRRKRTPFSTTESAKILQEFNITRESTVPTLQQCREIVKEYPSIFSGRKGKNIQDRASTIIANLNK